MAHTQKPDFVFWQNGQVHFNRRGRQFSRLAGELYTSACRVCTARASLCSAVMWRLLATVSCFPFISPPVRKCVPSRFNWTLPRTLRLKTQLVTNGFGKWCTLGFCGQTWRQETKLVRTELVGNNNIKNCLQETVWGSGIEVPGSCKHSV